jgi:hypothetical protein
MRLEEQLNEWIAYADKLERVLELVCGQSKDQLMKIHAEQGMRIVRPEARRCAECTCEKGESDCNWIAPPRT